MVARSPISAVRGGERTPRLRRDLDRRADGARGFTAFSIRCSTPIGTRARQPRRVAIPRRVALRPAVHAQEKRRGVRPPRRLVATAGSVDPARNALLPVRGSHNNPTASPASDFERRVAFPAGRSRGVDAEWLLTVADVHGGVDRPPVITWSEPPPAD